METIIDYTEMNWDFAEVVRRIIERFRLTEDQVNVKIDKNVGGKHKVWNESIPKSMLYEWLDNRIQTFDNKNGLRLCREENDEYYLSILGSNYYDNNDNYLGTNEVKIYFNKELNMVKINLKLGADGLAALKSICLTVGTVLHSTTTEQLNELCTNVVNCADGYFTDVDYFTIKTLVKAFNDNVSTEWVEQTNHILELLKVCYNDDIENIVECILSHDHQTVMSFLKDLEDETIKLNFKDMLTRWFGAEGVWAIKAAAWDLFRYTDSMIVSDICDYMCMHDRPNCNSVDGDADAVLDRLKEL